MLILYQSNDLNVLKNIFFNLLNKKLYSNIDCSTSVLVSNRDVSFMLKLYLAEKFGICANFNFYLIAQFIWNIFRILIPDIKEEDYLNKKNLFWVIITILPILLKKKEFFLIKNYLINDINNEKLFLLALDIADLYDKYLIYRIDWLKEWECSRFIKLNNNDINQYWQSLLWRKILSYYNKNLNLNFNKYYIYNKIINMLKKNNKLFNNFPKEIFIFNVTLIPNLYLDIIFSLSKYITIHYLIINPSKEYWFDQNNYILNEKINFNEEKNIYKKEKEINNDYYFKYCNFLLLKYSKSFSEYLSLLFNYNFYEIDNYIKYPLNSILNIIKNNIFCYKNIFFLKKKKKYEKDFFLKDNSIIINSCYGYLKEVEVLHNYILNLIINFSYNINDIVVMVSDLDIYYPYIESVFSNSLYKEYLPYSIMYKNITYKKKIFSLFFKILNLPNIECNTTEVLNILENEVILEKFDINNEEFETIISIVNNSGICNGIIKDKDLYYNNDNYSTWNSGIKRILLGYVIDKNFSFWENISPVSNIGNKYYNNLIGKLSDFLFKLVFWRNLLNKKYFFEQWIIYCKEILFVFFNKKYIEKYFLNGKIFNDLIYNYKFGNFNKKITLNLFIRILNKLIKIKNSKKRFSVNKLNFGSLISFDSMSFKVVCLLGLNSNIYPRDLLVKNFDLMQLNIRLNDRNKRNYDKYNFLNILMSVRDKLYISYINYSFKKRMECYPSILIDYLVDYIKYIFDIYSTKLVFLNNYNKNYFNNKYDKNIFSLFNYKNIKNRKNYLDWLEKYNILNEKKEKYLRNKKKKIKKKIKEINYIDLRKLHIFWINPIKFYFINILKINFFVNRNYINNEELFILNIKNFYLIRSKLILDFINNGYLNENIFCILQSLNLLPVNCFGELFWNNEKKKILFLIKNIHKYINNIKLYKFNLNIKDIYIKGFILLSNNICVIKWFPKNLNLVDILTVWIDHLIYCILGGTNYSYLYGYNGYVSYLPLKVDISIEILHKYIMCYIKSYIYPLVFLPKISSFWIFSLYDLKTKKFTRDLYLINIVKKKIYNMMFSKNYYKSELDDIYLSYFFKKFNKLLNLNILIKNAEKWLLPVLKYSNFFLKLK